MVYLLFVMLLSFAPLLGGLNWISDFKRAEALTREEKKPLVILFTSSSEEVNPLQEFLDSKECREKIEKRFLFTKVPLQGEEGIEMRRRFHLTELPRLVVLDENLREVSRWGLSELQRDRLPFALNEGIEKSHQLSEGMKRLTQLKPDELKKIYTYSIELKREGEGKEILSIGLASEEPLFFLLEKYASEEDPSRKAHLKERIFKEDPHNQMQSHFSLAILDFESLSKARPFSKEAIRPLEEYVKAHGEEDTANRWRIEMMIAQFYLNCDDWKSSLQHAEKAYFNAPDSFKKEIGHSCDFIREQLTAISKSENN